MTLSRFVLSLLLLAPGIARAAGEAWEIDPVHSTVGFRVRHMMVSSVSGSFAKFSGTIKLDEADVTKSGVAVEIDAASIDTRVADRDNHLRSADFFDVAKHPTIAFRSKTVEKGAAADRLKVTGDLTIHGVTKPLTLDITKSGPAGGRVGFSASTRLNRKDYGITWNKVLDAGGVAVSEEVDIFLDIAAAIPKPKEAASK